MADAAAAESWAALSPASLAPAQAADSRKSDPPTASLVGVRFEGPAARVILNWPEKRNALSLRMMRDLETAISRAARRAEVRAVVIASRGPVFSAGHFLPEMIGVNYTRQRQTFGACARLMRQIRQLPVPVIAEVQGIATAAGCQLVAACDLAVAAEDARFATPGVRIGLFCSTPMVPLSRVVSRKRAMEMLLTGEFISAPTALEWGLINRVAPETSLKATTAGLVRRIAAAGPYVVARGKREFYAQLAVSDEAAAEDMTRVMSRNAMHPDAQEGMRAFLEKRPPNWVGAAEPYADRRRPGQYG